MGLSITNDLTLYTTQIQGNKAPSFAGWPVGELQYFAADADGKLNVWGQEGAPFYIIPFTNEGPDLHGLMKLPIDPLADRSSANSIDQLYPPFIESNFPQGAWIR